MSNFIEVRDESGDVCLLNISEVVAVYGGSNGKASLVLKSHGSFTSAMSFAEIKKILGVKSNAKN